MESKILQLQFSWILKHKKKNHNFFLKVSTDHSVELVK
jgi:hypothetical protein